MPNDKTQMHNSRHAIHILKYHKGMIKIIICKRIHIHDILTGFVLWVDVLKICNTFQHNIKSSGVLNQYIYFVSEINKSTNNVQTVHTIYTQAEPIPTTLAENWNTGN